VLASSGGIQAGQRCHPGRGLRSSHALFHTTSHTGARKPQRAVRGRVGYLLVAIGGLGGSIAIGRAILRYRLHEIDLLINRALVYGALTALLVAVYVGSVISLQAALRALPGQESQLAVVASTQLIAALFNPLRHCSKRWWIVASTAASTTLPRP
jgi:hypothetical protein